MITTAILIGVICLGVGIACGMLLGKKGSISLREHTALLESAQREGAQAMETAVANARIAANDTLKAVQDEASQTKLDLQNARSAVDLARKEVDNIRSDAQRQIAEAQRAATEEFSKKFTEVTEMREKQLSELKDLFKGLSAEQIKEQTKDLQEIHKNSLSAILGPYKEKLESYERRLEETQTNNTKDRAQLLGQITAMTAETQAIGKCAKDLHDVLAHGGKALGVFGERVMADILEGSGLKEGTHYYLQAHFKDFDIHLGNDLTLIPDCCLRMPDTNAWLAVDSKATFTKYMALQECKDDTTRSAELQKGLVKDMKVQINSLFGKNYPEALKKDGKSPVVECTLMFVPSDQLLHFAYESDRTLQKYALDRNILMIGPENFIACIKCLSLAWGTVETERNIKDILLAVKDLHAAFEKWKKDFEDIGKSLDSAKANYDKAERLLKQTAFGEKMSIPDVARKIAKLGGIVEKAALKGTSKPSKEEALPESGAPVPAALPEPPAADTPPEEEPTEAEA